MTTQLTFPGITPVAAQGLGGLVRDHFANGRLFATVGAHGGLLGVGYWGRQHLGAKDLFRADPVSSWVKLLRLSVHLGGEHRYPTLAQTNLFPFGYASRGAIAGQSFDHDLLLLPDALVQRLRFADATVGFRLELVHMEGCTAVAAGGRKWSPMAFEPNCGLLLGACLDCDPTGRSGVDMDSLAQRGLQLPAASGEEVATWVGIGCDAPAGAVRASHIRGKHRLITGELRGQGAFFMVFAASREALIARARELAASGQAACDALIGGYRRRLASRPRIATGDAVLDSAFGQYPEAIETMKVPDRPGAVRATTAGYFIWGWDGLTPVLPCTLANEPEFAAAILRFFHQTRDPRFGLPHAFTSTFGLAMRGPVAAQCQFIASLYQVVAATGDLAIAREVWPTCLALLARCREHEVGRTGLVAGCALWPDFPEEMGEDGDDLSSLNNSLLYQALRGMEHLAAALGDETLAAECREWAARLRASFVARFYDREQGFFVSSCSSRTFLPRRHFISAAVLWLLPFARELVAHDPVRIAAFMHRHLRGDRCLQSLPRWDDGWMADGNQIGASYPIADLFYLNVHKLAGEPRALDAWLGDVEWFWRRHTAPEAFTPEADNESDLGPDNPGCRQLQAVSAWYAGLYQGLAGLDLDHEGVTLTPWGGRPLSISGLRLRGCAIDLAIDGRGPHLAGLALDGRPLPVACRKLPWSAFAGPFATLAIRRSETPPDHPVIVRADGLRVVEAACGPGRLAARIEGGMSGEVVVQAPPDAEVLVDGVRRDCLREPGTGHLLIPYPVPGTGLALLVTRAG